MRDSELIKRIKQGERELLDILVERYYEDVLKFCFYKTGDETSAYDCAQDTFLRFIKYISTYKEKEKFKAYILRVAVNVCNDYFAKNSKRKEFPLESIGVELEDQVLKDGRAQVNSTFASRQTASFEIQIANLDFLRMGLSQLPKEQSEALVLRYFNDLKVSEIARVTGATIPAIKSRIHMGINKLKEFIAQENLAENSTTKEDKHNV